jgi:hypothetical protein
MDHALREPFRGSRDGACEWGADCQSGGDEVIAPVIATLVLIAVMTFVILTTNQREDINLSREAENALRKLDREHRLLRERARMNS